MPLFVFIYACICFVYFFLFFFMSCAYIYVSKRLSRQTLVGKKKRQKKRIRWRRVVKTHFCLVHVFFFFSHYMLFKISSGAIDLSLFLLCHKSTS